MVVVQANNLKGWNGLWESYVDNDEKANHFKRIQLQAGHESDKQSKVLKEIRHSENTHNLIK